MKLTLEALRPGYRACGRWILGTLMLASSVPVLADSDIAQEFGELRSQLESLGWRVERSAAGDLLLWPPGASPAAVPSAVAADARQGESFAMTDIELLRKRLAESGWDVRKSEDGSLMLYPATTAETTAPSAPTTPESDRFEDVRALLAASGWRVERDQTGDLLLYPGGAAETDQRGDSALLQVESGDLERVRDSLLATGWQLADAADGTLLVYPDSGQSSRSTARSSQTKDPVASGEIELPVDSWDEARRISGYWLEQQLRTDLSIGKIRKVNWVYLVSIVESSPPFRLHNQLAIRTTDGRVVSLH